jgi:hypothetical protein
MDRGTNVACCRIARGSTNAVRPCARSCAGEEGIEREWEGGREIRRRVRRAEAGGRGDRVGREVVKGE